MNPNQQTLNRIVEVVSKGSAGVIAVPANATIDAIAAATSLYLALTKMGKTVSLASSNPLRSDLTAADKFQTSLATNGNNLVVSFPYTDGAIDKVDYNIQGNFFNLIIAPRDGYSKLNPTQVKFSYTGGNIDFIIAIDSPNLNTLGALYTDNQAQFQGKDIINIDRHLTNGFYGSINFVNKTASSTSELILKILQTLNVEIDKDIASNLYAGLTAATNNFGSYSVNADTFEVAANLLKLGAVKKSFRPVPPAPVVTQFKAPSFSQKPIGAVEHEPSKPDAQQKPQDWLKPKIFKNGGGLV